MYSKEEMRPKVACDWGRAWALKHAGTYEWTTNKVVPDGVEGKQRLPKLGTHQARHQHIFTSYVQQQSLLGFKVWGGTQTRMEAPWKPATLEPGALTAVGLQGQVRYHYTSDWFWITMNKYKSHVLYICADNIHIHTHTYTYTCNNVNLHAHVILYVYVYVYIHLYVYVHVHINICICICICTHICIYICMYIYICTYIRDYMRMYDVYAYTHVSCFHVVDV